MEIGRRLFRSFILFVVLSILCSSLYGSHRWEGTKQIEKSKLRPFIYYNKPPKTGSTSIQAWLLETARMNNLTVARLCHPILCGDKVFDDNLKSFNFDRYDMFVGHHIMNRYRWNLLRNKLKNRNLITITSIRRPEDRISSQANQILSSQMALKSCIDKPGFKNYMKTFMFIFDENSLFRYYCADTKCQMSEIVENFDFVIDLWGYKTGVKALVKALRKVGITSKKEIDENKNNRLRGSHYTHSEYYHTDSTLLKLYTERRLYNALRSKI